MIEKIPIMRIHNCRWCGCPCFTRDYAKWEALPTSDFETVSTGSTYPEKREVRFIQLNHVRSYNMHYCKGKP